MYSIDGIALHNPGMGWKFRGPSRPLSDLNAEKQSLRQPGVPGVVADVDDRLASLLPPAPTFMVQTPRRHYADLLSLFVDGEILSLSNNPDRQARYDFLSSSHNGLGDADSTVDVTATLRLPGVFWRDTEERTISTPITSASMTLDLWVGTGLITDAVIRARAPFADLVLRSRKSVLRLGALGIAGQFIRYHCATGRAYLTTTDTWTGGALITGATSAVGPGNRFGIYPTRTSPSEARARLTIATFSRGSGAQLEVRGRGAHVA